MFSSGFRYCDDDEEIVVVTILIRMQTMLQYSMVTSVLPLTDDTRHETV